MKIQILSLFFFVLLPTYAAADYYVGAAGGAVMTHDSDVNLTGIGSPIQTDVTVDYDIGYGLIIYAGYKFSGIRTDIEIGHKSAEADKVHSVSTLSGTKMTADTAMSMHLTSYMLNLFYDFKNNSKISPYTGVGLGVFSCKFKNSDTNYSKTDQVLGYQAVLGAAYKLTDKLLFDISYRFQGAAQDFKIDRTEISYMSSSFYGGLRYEF